MTPNPSLNSIESEGLQLPWPFEKKSKSATPIGPSHFETKKISFNYRFFQKTLPHFQAKEKKWLRKKNTFIRSPSQYWPRED